MPILLHVLRSTSSGGSCFRIGFAEVAFGRVDVDSELLRLVVRQSR